MDKTINLKTALPGPKSQELLVRRAASTPAGLAKSTEIGVADANGAIKTPVSTRIGTAYKSRAVGPAVRSFRISR